MRFFYDLFVGRRIIALDCVRAETLMTRAISCGVNIYGAKKISDTGLELCLSRPDSERVRGISEELGGGFRIIREWGVPRLFERYGKRYGIFAGILLFTAIVFLSTRFVWRVEVSGKPEGSIEEYINTIKEAGLGVGTPISGLDIDNIQHRCVLLDDRIAWISLNRVGTVVTAEIREAMREKLPDKTPANIIADFDGQIESIEVHSGTPVVLPGQSVKKGDLLISGVVDGSADGVRSIRADGRVFARVSSTLRVEIPFENTEKVYSGRKVREKSLIFFGKQINLFIKYGNLLSKYDTMINRRSVRLYDGTVLPVGFDTVTYSEYEVRDCRLMPDEAASRAFSELRRQVDSTLKDSMLLSREQSAYFTEDSYVIECELYYLRDIAGILPIG